MRRHILEPHHKEHLRKLGVTDVSEHLDIHDAKYAEHFNAWKRTLPDAPDHVIHGKVLGHEAWQKHCSKSAPKTGEQENRVHVQVEHPRSELRWIMALLALLALLLIFHPKAHAQFSHINTITTKQGGSAVGFHASPFNINCGANLTCTDDGSTFNMVAGSGATVAWDAILSPTAGGASISIFANGNAFFTVKRKTDTAPTGSFFDYQTAAGVSLCKLDITGTFVGCFMPYGSLTGVPAVPGSGSELQYRASGTTFGAVTGSSVSGSAITLGGILSIPVGSFAAPSLSFVGQSTSGFWWGGGNVAIASAGVDVFTTQSTGIQIASAGVYQWSSSGGATANVKDAGISRLAAGSFAFGNGTAGDFSGTIKTTTVNAVTGFQVNGLALNFSHLSGTATDGQLANAYSGVGTPTVCTNQAITGFTLTRNAAPTSICTTITSAFTSGTFAPNAHNLLSASHGDTTAGTVARGDVITGQGASPTWTRLAKGSANQVLSMDGSGVDIVWANAAAGSGTVTHTVGALTLNQLVFGNGAADIAVGDLTGDITTSGGKATTLAASGVTGTTCGDTTHSCGLTYNSKGLITAATNNVIAGGGGSFDPLDMTVKQAVDNFTNPQVSSTSNLGDLNWTLTGSGSCTPTYESSSSANIPASLRITTGGTSGNGCEMYKNDIAGGQQLFSGLQAVTGKTYNEAFRFRLSSVANIRFRIGWSFVAGSALPASGAWCRFDTNIGDSAVFVFEIRAGGVSVTANSTIAPQTTNPHKCKIYHNGTSWLGSVDGETPVTIGTKAQGPNSTSPGVNIFTDAATTKYVELYQWGMSVTGMTP